MLVKLTNEPVEMFVKLTNEPDLPFQLTLKFVDVNVATNCNLKTARCFVVPAIRSR